MSTPMRFQLSRRRGYKMPANGMSVARPALFGNPFSDLKTYGIEVSLTLFSEMMQGVWNPATIAAQPDRIARVIYDDHQRFRRHLPGHPQEAARALLRGKNLGCWCRLCPAHAAGKPLGVECPDCAPCHADILLRISNG